MSHGNLAGKLVSREFWPACTSCRFFQACKTRPRHAAYPHRWQWGRDAVSFPDGDLILCSWVGSSVIGQPHTGCLSYEVAPAHVRDPQPQQHCYLVLEQEKAQIERQFAHLEHKETWTKRDKATFQDLLHRYRHVLAQQATLRSSAPQPEQLAAVVNA
jgi:hypothetical protein